MNYAYEAFQEWNTRPDDQRFRTCASAAEYLQDRRVRTVDTTVAMEELQFQALPAKHGGETLTICREGRRPALLTNYAFDQLCRVAGAQTGTTVPPRFLAALPPANVAADLNAIWQAGLGDRNTLLATRDPGGDMYRVRTVASERFGFLYDCEALSWLADLESKGWQAPPARPARPGMKSTRIATPDDIIAINRVPGGGLSVQVGDEIADAGIYAGDRDFFVFLMNTERTIEINGEELCLGMIVRGSELAGVTSYTVTLYLFRGACGNHILHDVRDTAQFRRRHIGSPRKSVFAALQGAERSVLDDGASGVKGLLQGAMRYEWPTKAEALAAVVKRTALPQKTVSAGWDWAEENDLNPRSAWGMVNGLTGVAHDLGRRTYDARFTVEKAASKLLQVA